MGMESQKIYVMGMSILSPTNMKETQMKDYNRPSKSNSEVSQNQTKAVY